jgi:hypothetical protein
MYLQAELDPILDQLVMMKIQSKSDPEVSAQEI